MGENGSGGLKHLLFVWKTTGYELRERDGEAPQAGQEVQEEDGTFVVNRVATSPLPGDRRRCAYLVAK